MQEGLPVPSLGYKTLMYKCNAIGCIYITWITAFLLHYTGIFRLTAIIDNFGHLMSVAMLWGFGVTFFMYFITVLAGNPIRMSGNLIYDIFMGACLNPRIGPIDLKMWLEVRIPWVIVFFMSVSGACKQYETYGYVTPVSQSWRDILCNADDTLWYSRTWPSCAWQLGSISTPAVKVRNVFLKLGICSTKSMSISRLLC